MKSNLRKLPGSIVFLLCSVSLVFLISCGKGQERNAAKALEIPTDGYPITVEDSGSPQVDSYLRQLVSNRPAPYPSSFWPVPMSATFADRYSTPEVEAALKGLKAMGTSVFPHLVKHMRDDRYSYSFVSAAWLNCSVAEAVVEVLCDGEYMHSGYKGRDTPKGTEPYLSFDAYLKVRTPEAWAEWAMTRTRLEIQLDFIDWSVEEENKRGYTDENQRKHVLERYEEARQSMKEHYSATPEANR